MTQAIVHPVYTRNASVQVVFFRKRIEIWNSGSLKPSLTPETPRGPHSSVPDMPLPAESMHLTKSTERMEAGIVA